MGAVYVRIHQMSQWRFGNLTYDNAIIIIRYSVYVQSAKALTLHSG